MTGTANEFHDFNESTNLDLFSAWLFGRINANCLLSDISRDGCSILIPNKQSAPSGDFKLLIMSPEDNEKLHSIVMVKQRWQDRNHSSTHKKIGVEFQNMGPDQVHEINVLLRHFEISAGTSVKCSLLKC